jgi:aqualysin 1
MRRTLRWLFTFGIVVTALVLGCSGQNSDINAPSGNPSTVLAPLIDRVPGGTYIDGSYIVVLKESATSLDKDVDDVSQSLGIRPDYRYRSSIRGFSGKLSPATLDALRKDSRVAYIEQDQVARIVTTQTNPTWGLDRIDQRARPLDAAYAYNQTGAGVDAYIIDTGIHITHNEFGGRAVAGYDAVTSGGTADDGNGHGTHVAGTVGGATYGVAKGVRLIAVRVLDNSGSGTYSGVIAGVDWVTADHTTRPAVANMSLGGPTSTALDDAVRRSITDGVTYCIAAGNSAANASTQSPARVAEAITVGATDSGDVFASFSNYGSTVDISAPGVNITSAWGTSDTATNTISGTSMATPHVAGAAALYLETDPTAVPATVASALVANATAGVLTSLPSGTVNKLLYSLVGPPPPPGPPGAPALISPVDGATGLALSPTLSWSASAGAASYRVQVSTNSAFPTTVSDQAGLTSTSTGVSGLANATVYYWRVNAANTYGTSGWSGVRSFATAGGTPPSAPTLVSPVNGATNVSRSPTLVWSASAGATSYRVQVSTLTNFSSLVYDRSGLTATSATVSGLGSRVDYYWRVNATNASGTSAWSAYRRLRTVK